MTTKTTTIAKIKTTEKVNAIPLVLVWISIWLDSWQLGLVMVAICQWEEDYSLTPSRRRRLSKVRYS